MNIGTSAEQDLLRSELLPAETLLWVGRPNPRVLFHASDAFTIPFSLLWAGFTIFSELGVSGRGPAAEKHPSLSMMLWGIPFVLVGQYIVWGRFLYVFWKKHYVLYALTTERALVLVHGWGRKTITVYLHTLPGLHTQTRPDGIGTVHFGEPCAYDSHGRGKSRSGPDNLYLNAISPVFADIDNAAQVAALASQAMRQRQEMAATQPQHR